MQAARLVAAVAELGSLGMAALRHGSHEDNFKTNLAAESGHYRWFGVMALSRRSVHLLRSNVLAETSRTSRPVCSSPGCRRVRTALSVGHLPARTDESEPEGLSGGRSCRDRGGGPMPNHAFQPTATGRDIAAGIGAFVRVGCILGWRFPWLRLSLGRSASFDALGGAC